MSCTMTATNICRICLKSGSLESWNSLESLQELFKHITNIKVDVNNDPQKNVCIKCIEKLEEISDFIEISKHNDIIIKNNLSSHYVDVKRNLFESSENLAYNFSTIAESIKQELPKKPTKSRKLLSTQMKAKTPDHLRPFECPLCKKQFTQKGNMQTHLRLHTGEKPFQCLLCPEKYPQLSNLNKHILSHINDGSKCNFCFKEFDSQEKLKKHRKTHKGDKQYLCYFCSKKFSYSWSLDTHLQLNHNDQFAEIATAKKKRKCHMSFGKQY